MLKKLLLLCCVLFLSFTQAQAENPAVFAYQANDFVVNIYADGSIKTSSEDFMVAEEYVQELIALLNQYELPKESTGDASIHIQGNTHHFDMTLLSTIDFDDFVLTQEGTEDGIFAHLFMEVSYLLRRAGYTFMPTSFTISKP